MTLHSDSHHEEHATHAEEQTDSTLPPWANPKKLEYEEDLVPKMQMSEEEMMANRIHPSFRDFCAQLLVPLNKCRREHYYAPWECTEERNIYKACKWNDQIRRKKLAAIHWKKRVDANEI